MPPVDMRSYAASPPRIVRIAEHSSFAPLPRSSSLSREVEGGGVARVASPIATSCSQSLPVQRHFELSRLCQEPAAQADVRAPLPRSFSAPRGSMRCSSNSQLLTSQLRRVPETCDLAAVGRTRVKLMARPPASSFDYSIKSSTGSLALPPCGDVHVAVSSGRTNGSATMPVVVPDHSPRVCREQPLQHQPYFLHHHCPLPAFALSSPESSPISRDRQVADSGKQSPRAARGTTHTSCPSDGRTVPSQTRPGLHPPSLAALLFAGSPSAISDATVLLKDIIQLLELIARSSEWKQVNACEDGQTCGSVGTRSELLDVDRADGASLFFSGLVAKSWRLISTLESLSRTYGSAEERPTLTVLGALRDELLASWRARQGAAHSQRSDVIDPWNDCRLLAAEDFVDFLRDFAIGSRRLSPRHRRCHEALSAGWVSPDTGGFGTPDARQAATESCEDCVGFLSVKTQSTGFGDTDTVSTRSSICTASTGRSSDAALARSPCVVEEEHSFKTFATAAPSYVSSGSRPEFLWVKPFRGSSEIDALRPLASVGPFRGASAESSSPQVAGTLQLGSATVQAPADSAFDGDDSWEEEFLLRCLLDAKSPRMHGVAQR